MVIFPLTCFFGATLWPRQAWPTCNTAICLYTVTVIKFTDRDLKLSNGCDPKFNEAVLATTYAWSVNYKPHGSGAFGDEKYDLLANFFDTCVMEDSLKANLIILVLCFF